MIKYKDFFNKYKDIEKVEYVGKTDNIDAFIVYTKENSDYISIWYDLCLDHCSVFGDSGNFIMQAHEGYKDFIEDFKNRELVYERKQVLQ